MLKARLKAINERRFQNIENQVADLKDDIQENLKNMVCNGINSHWFESVLTADVGILF